MTAPRHWSVRRLAILLLGLALAGCGAGVLPAIHSEEERLAVARRLLGEGQYVTASELLRTYVANNAGSADVDQAIYLLGYAQLRSKEWTSAATEFERLLRDYPESDSSAAARYGLAESQLAQSRPPDFDQEFTHRALAEWQRYLNDFPGQPLHQLHLRGHADDVVEAQKPFLRMVGLKVSGLGRT